MQLKERIEQISKDIEKLTSEGKSLFLSSSFQTHSIPLLHIISTIDKTIPIYFLNTGFHFPETMQFRNDISNLLGMEVIDLRSEVEKIHQKDSRGNFFYTSDPAYCCHINKVLPMDAVLREKDVWIAGVRADQNSNRNQLGKFEMGAHGTLRYHPILNWTSKDIHMYREKYQLPPNPLEEKGYLSVGCEPCTSKFLDEGRGGRWNGMAKDECGLHVDLIKK